MKRLITSVLIIFLIASAIAQPKGNGNGNGGNGNNGNGNGGCANPPCGGPNSVPLNVELLLFAGLIIGCYIKFTIKRKAKA